MSLHFDYTKCNKYTLPEPVVIDAMIWSCMFVGIDEITIHNYDEFYARIHAMEVMNGTQLLVNGEPRYIQPEECYNMIGLKTNASRKTKAQFSKQLMGYVSTYRSAAKLKQSNKEVSTQ